MRYSINYLLILFLILNYSCDKGDDETNCPPVDNIHESPYKDPIWHPTDKIIGFNHTPLKSIIYTYGLNCPKQATYIYEGDLTGFWLIDEDGTNKRRVLPFILNTPAWSRDGKWIAFSKNAQIFVMPFDGVEFDTSAITQLTFEGRNFFPAWSPDGEWIAYDSNNDSPTGLNFIWKMRKNGAEKSRIAFTPNQGETRRPFWSEESLIIHQRYIGRSSSEIFLMDSNGENLIRLTDNDKSEYAPQLSPNKKYAGYISAADSGLYELWTIDRTSNDMKQLTFSGCQNYSWSPEGKIVYENYDYSQPDEEKGTLWIMNSNGTEKKQLTFNDFEVLE